MGTVDCSISSALGSRSPPTTTIGTPASRLCRKPLHRSSGPAQDAGDDQVALRERGQLLVGGATRVGQHEVGARGAGREQVGVGGGHQGDARHRRSFVEFSLHLGEARRGHDLAGRARVPTRSRSQWRNRLGVHSGGTAAGVARLSPPPPSARSGCGSPLCDAPAAPARVPVRLVLDDRHPGAPRVAILTRCSSRPWRPRHTTGPTAARASRGRGSRTTARWSGCGFPAATARRPCGRCWTWPRASVTATCT